MPSRFAAPLRLAAAGADRLIAGIALAALSPILAAIALAVRMTSGSPVLFRQQRSGRGGRPFSFVKFRTMRPPASAAETSPDHDAPRLTRLGRMLRSTSLDELPTLVHVVRGDMALVGPRPLPIAYLARYTDLEARRLEVRPGITGWAQVNGRNETTWPERLAMDVWYVDHRSRRLDWQILARTLRVVLRRDGVDRADGVTMPEFTGSGRR